MYHAVLFLVLSCELVLLDLTFSIVISMSADNESVLCAAVHCLCIYIIVWLLVLYKPTFLLPAFEVLYSFVICRLTVLVNDRVEVNFRLCNVQKRFFTCFGLGFH